MKATSVIQTGGLTKRFDKFTAVDSVSLDIREAEIYGFLGLNGAGKTTTIRMLLGMIQPSGGSAALLGEEVSPGRRTIWEKVGYLVETPHHYPDLTVKENLEIFRRLRQIKEPGAVDVIIEKMGLEPYAEKRARHLSLGNSQRLGLAKALIHHPALLILDEPANALDPAGIVEVRNLLRDLAEKEGVTIFISSHILSEIARLATRIGIIHEGKMVKELYTRELADLEEPRLAADVGNAGGAISALVKRGFAAYPNGNHTILFKDAIAIERPEQVAAALVQEGFPPSRLVIERIDLESYFLKLVGAAKEVS
ncbi:MAG TPA: ABC transporter ATP-binding protein [Dehalococcoidales bacterium]|nr:ABC transporter ATP-binding protein [Dehalococcoidales bacterium]